MVAVRVQGTWNTVKLISKSTGGQYADMWKYWTMSIRRTTGRENVDEEYVGSSVKIKTIGVG